MIPPKPNKPSQKPPSTTASKGDLHKVRKALPPQLVNSMLDDISNIDPSKAKKTGTLGKVGHLTAHVVDPETLAIHHGMNKVDLSEGGTNHSHGDIVPKGKLYISHDADHTKLPDHLIARAVEAYLIDRGWKHDAAARIAKHLQEAPADQQEQPQEAPETPQEAPPDYLGGGELPPELLQQLMQQEQPQGPPEEQSQGGGGMPGMPPWMMGRGGM